MPIDDGLLDAAREIHDEMMAYGMTNEAAAIRYAVSVAVAEQEEEDRFGTDNISACIDAIMMFRSALIGLSDRRPITASSTFKIMKVATAARTQVISTAAI